MSEDNNTRAAGALMLIAGGIIGASGSSTAFCAAVGKGNPQGHCSVRQKDKA